MIDRSLENKIRESLQHFPVVGILGSRQVGKTTLAMKIKASYKDALYLDLELPSDMSKLEEPELYLRHHAEKLVIIDEIQLMPELFPLMRALVDQKRKPGRFLILGSASPVLIRSSSETLAGRIMYHELMQFTLDEVGITESTINKLWQRGGYPLSFLADTNTLSLMWREAFIKTYLERDIPQLGLRVPAAQLRRFWTMTAHVHGQLWNANKIASSLDVSAPTVRHYLDILQDTFIVRQLLPYYANIKKRLVKSPKVYLRDSGILHSLLRCQSLEDLRSHPIAGASWEGFVIEQISAIIPDYWDLYFFRTSAGAEIDVIISIDSGRLLAVEIKYSLSPKLSRGFRNAFQDLDCFKGFIVYLGDEFYPLDKDIFALPISQIGQIVASV